MKLAENMRALANAHKEQSKSQRIKLEYNSIIESIARLARNGATALTVTHLYPENYAELNRGGFTVEGLTIKW